MSYDLSDWQVTPKHELSEFKLPLSLEQKIDIFFERTDGWQLGIADKIINGVIDQNGKRIEPSESAYTVLNIVFGFFETIAKYEDGYVSIHESRRYFKEGLKSIFPEIDLHPKLLEMLYSDVRCGLYHSGCTNPRVFVMGDIKAAIAFTKQGRLLINPRILVLKLREHLKFYVEELRNANNTKLRENFEKRFDFLNN